MCVRLPVCGSHPEAGDDGHEARDEDCAAAAGVLVQDGGAPAPDEGGTEVRRAVDESLHCWVILETERLVIELLA